MKLTTQAYLLLTIQQMAEQMKAMADSLYVISEQIKNCDAILRRMYDLVNEDMGKD